MLRIDPFAMRDWLGKPLGEIVNCTIALADVDRRLANQVEAATNQRGLRTAFMTADPSSPTKRRGRIEVAARLVGGGCSVEAAAGAVNLSARQLERLFHRELGMSPRQWRSIIRFRAAALAARRGTGLAEAAIIGGYADQAHFTRASKALTGKTPRALIAQHVGIIQDAEIGRF
ncbi:MAG: helix-turn-helix domain-containing protein [Sphingobium sp.]|nr:helix-turn-helix domain-containing protein [Sphingobium sp.]